MTALNKLADELVAISSGAANLTTREDNAITEAARLLRSAAGADVAGLMAKFQAHIDEIHAVNRGDTSASFACVQSSRETFESALRLLVAQIPRWTLVEDAMPLNGKTVLACYKNSAGNLRRVRACWVAAKTSESSSESDFGEYDEAADTYYDPEGWYEQIDNWDDCTAVFISDPVTCWQELPLASKEE